MFFPKISPVWIVMMILSVILLSGCTDTPCVDNDGDGYGNPASSLCTYLNPDCDDTNADVNPGVTEGSVGDPTCSDGLDNDCDRNADLEDPGCVPCEDNDGDGYGDPASESCTYSELDCDDSDADVNPAATEICDNSVDDDCDGLIDENDPACGGTGLLPYTGQTACYDDNGNEISCPESGQAFYGQDAQYTGNEFNYTDNGDGSVTDNVTGLTWQQTPQNMGLSWQDAYDYCESLGLAGHGDWRMPTLKELFSISDFSLGWPYLDTTYFDIAGTFVSKDEQYWADNYYVGTTVEGGSAASFGVNHGTGHIKAYPANISGPMAKRVRAVRGNTYGVNDFEDNGDGTVTDHATGLMWQQADSGSGMDWEDALAYAEGLTLAGHDDWRLPNVKELQSIVDYTRSPSASDPSDLGPAIDTGFFDITELASGTRNYSPDYGFFWTSTSAYFGLDSPEYYYAWYVAFGTAPNDAGNDFHGAGAVRFDTKIEGNESGAGDDERVYNYVRAVRTVQ